MYVVYYIGQVNFRYKLFKHQFNYNTAIQSASLSPIYESNLVSEDLPDPGKVLDSLSMSMDYIIEPPTAFSDTSTQCSLLTPITDSILQYIESLYYVFGITETSSLNEVHKEPTESFMKSAELPDEVADLVIELMKMRQNVMQPNLESPPVMTDVFGQFGSCALLLPLVIQLSTYLSGLSSGTGGPLQLIKTNEDICPVVKAFLFEVNILYITLNDLQHSEEEIAIVLTAIKRGCR
ncbi:uncharacterized protein LOC126901035 isoform X1 [Daktulosphaira vitifoliae]|uniref:uncharacterized protein LOC126901035 isoform X1 n=1 Tax=Daktulosphaira vitifoliae TaxID=58002 RepID=UPI0021AA9CB6|nr:uncharacterized protein LOC126901035 isoform X1 [Daktulosphaira vitifoliae]